MNFIYQIITTINSDDWYGVSENVEIMKGKNKLKSFRETIKHIKRLFLLKIKK